MVTMNNENGLKNNENSRKWYGKWQMIGTDDDGGVSGDDCTEAEASAECSDIRGNCISLDFLSYYDLLQGFYTMCKCNLTDLRRILHLSLAKGNPKLIYKSK
jgi:hypothetical protein